MTALTWVEGATTTSNGSGEALGVAVASPSSDVAIGGSFGGTTTFGSVSITDVGEGDAFAARLCN